MLSTAGRALVLRGVFEDGDVGEVAVAFGEIQPVADDEGVGDGEAEIVDGHVAYAPLLLGVLKGAFVFMSDLVRAIDLKVGVEFMAISSYGAEMRTSGEVKIVKDLDVPIEGRDLLIVEDIVDTGLTLSYLIANLHSRGASSVKLAALLNKQERRIRDVPIDYLGFTIPDAFVVGYGLDFAERYRNLPYIAVIKDPSLG